MVIIAVMDKLGSRHFPLADSDKDIVDHVDFRADSTADKQNYEMQLIWGKIHAVNNTPRNVRPMRCPPATTATQQTRMMPMIRSMYSVNFFTLFSHYNSAMVVMVGLNTNSHISEITKDGINRML